MNAEGIRKIALEISCQSIFAVDKEIRFRLQKVDNLQDLICG
jgi:hypothetical protein